MCFIFTSNYWITYTLLRSASNYEMVSYIFPAVGSQTEEHRLYVPSRADALSGATPFTLTDSESAYRSEYGLNEAATDS